MTGQRDNGTFFTVTWENDIREFFSTYRRQSAPRAWCWGSCSSKHCECISRLYQHIIFFFLFVMSYLWTMAPGLLAVLDTAVTSTLYYLFAPEAQEPRAPTWEFRFQKSLLDVVVLTMVRAFSILVAYGACSDMRNCYRPYKVAALMLATVSSIYVVGKAWHFSYSGNWLPPWMFALSVVISWLHVLEAHRMVQSARRRKRVGLVGAGLDGSEREWLLEAVAGGGGTGGSGGDEGGDVPPMQLADPDSSFIECEGLTVHYKVTGSPSDDTAVLLLHGFGGGVFSWRHVMGPLAQKCDCRVLALDRPAFGLTSRPPARRFTPGSNPYTIRAQARMAVRLCELLGIRRVLVVGHGDGALLALLAAEGALGGGGGGGGGAGGAGQVPLEVIGTALLDANLSGEVVPTFTGLLLNTRMGRAMLRPLLRSELGDVSNRKAWHDSSKLTPEVLRHYRAPLRVEGWDQALIEFSRQRAEVGSKELKEHLEAVAHLPCLIVVGEKDKISQPRTVEKLARGLPHSVVLEIPACGHLPHEECPDELLASLVPFVQAAVSGAGGGGVAGSPTGLVQRLGGLLKSSSSSGSTSDNV